MRFTWDNLNMLENLSTRLYSLIKRKYSMPVCLHYNIYMYGKSKLWNLKVFQAEIINSCTYNRNLLCKYHIFNSNYI